MRVLRVVVVCALMLPAGLAAAQEAAPEVTVNISRGLSADRPYTLAYPDTMQIVEDGDDITVATLEFPGAPLQCDAMIAEGAAAGWTAEAAAQNLDQPATAAGWVGEFPGFTISSVGTVAFQSGPALYYEGKSENSPFGVPTTVFHAEAVDGGRTYIFECLADTAIATNAKSLVDFLYANFSTRSDGGCCIDPTVPKD